MPDSLTAASTPQAMTAAVGQALELSSDGTDPVRPSIELAERVCEITLSGVAAKLLPKASNQ
jgi:hypothetical protein